jgi:hypothetical protein
MPSLTPSAPPDASDTQRGLVSFAAQTLQGVKTFLARAVMTLGITSGANRLDLRSDLGASASDVCSVVGSTASDGSVNANAKLISFRTGIGATEIEKLWIDKLGDIRAAGLNLGRFRGSSASLGFLSVDDSVGLTLAFNAVRVVVDSGNVTIVDQVTLGNLFRFSISGAQSLRGTDSTSTPGNVTIDKPSGKSAIAAGASTVRVTNSLVASGSRVLVTPHARDATCKELVAIPGPGFFDVSGTASATSAVPFSWEVSNLL